MTPIRAISITFLAAAFATGCAARKATWEAGKAPTPAPAPAAADGAAPDAKLEELLSAGDEAWKMRGDPARLNEAIAKWDEAAKLQPTTETYTKLSRAWYFLAEANYTFDPTKKGDLLAAYDKGVQMGESAIAAASPEFVQKVKGGAKWEDAVAVIGPEGVPAMYWYATNLGKWASAQGFMKRLANKDRLYAVMTRVLALNPDYFYAAPHRYFGAYYAILPAFAGGDLTKSEAHFREALNRSPNYFATKVLMAAELATKQQNKALFEKLLKEVIATDVAIEPDIAPEQAVEKRKAEDLLKQMDEKF